jgi:PIN domain nuclease of toxin-antitoxin system
VLSKLADAGQDPATAWSELRAATGDTDALLVESLTEADCVEVARLRPRTRALGLSLADRACLALATRLKVPALTADTRVVAAGHRPILARPFLSHIHSSLDTVHWTEADTPHT